MRPVQSAAAADGAAADGSAAQGAAAVDGAGAASGESLREKPGDSLGQAGAGNLGASGTGDAATADGGTRQVPPVERPLEELARFYDALDDVRAGRRERSVVVTWLGDSHTAADFMTERVRAGLQEVGGDGGAGFVRVGMSQYRHGAALLDKQGKWRKEPVLPAQRTRVLDGVFGYAGIRTIPGASATATVRLRGVGPSAAEVVEGAAAAAEGAASEGAAAEGAAASEDAAASEGAAAEGADGKLQASWTLSYRLEAGEALRVRLGEQSQVLAEAGEAGVGGIRYFTVVGDPKERLQVLQHGGSPEVFGVFSELSQPGAILDTAGINGARVATPLAWEPKQFAAAIEARRPDLLVLAYGTNEAFDRTSVAKYRQHVLDLIARVRDGAPELPCWVVGPPDAAGKSTPSRPRVLEITEVYRGAAAEAGCAFSSAFELMGGEGSFARWRDQRPTLARTDGIHLSIAGYRKLGDELARALLGAGAVPVASE